MTQVCSRIAQFLTSASAQRVVEYLCEEVVDESEGKAAMQWLGEHRPDIRNSALCCMYDVACYHIGTSCFVDTAPSSDHDKWFVSVVCGSELDLQGLDVELAASREAAEALAVETYGLVNKFFGHAVEAQTT